MFNRFYESFYLTILVNIVVSGPKTIIYIEKLNKKAVVSHTEEIFNTNEFTNEINSYISQAIKESPYFYISILDNSTSQGVIPTCAKENTSFFYDLSVSKYRCYKNRWIYYSEKSNIYDIEKTYSKIGVDFIFSPFIILTNFFKDKINTHLAMFILIQENSVLLSIFDNAELLFGEYLDMSQEIETHEELSIENHDIEEIELDDEESDDSIDLDDIDALDDIDELDDFGAIADLDSIEDIDEFSEAKDVEEELAEQEIEEDNTPISEDDGFSDDYQRFFLIQNSIKEFYKNPKYKSEFVETVYIADSIGVNGDLKQYLEEEMFLNVYVRNMDLAAELCEITKMELS